MNNFNTYINNIINESILDITRNSLDPTVFEFPDDRPPIMHPMIKTQIMADIEKIKEVTKVVVYFVVGSILTKKYSPHSDIDVNVQIDVPDDNLMLRIFDLIRHLNGKLAAGTTHPINYYVIKSTYDLGNTNAAYDVANEAWVKEPEDIDLNVKKYMERFQNSVNGIDFNTAELRRDIIDYEALQDMDTTQINDLKEKTQEKLQEIEDGVEALVRSYKNVTTLRRQAFDRDMSPTEIRKYGKKNKLPENVIYKLLERYYYFDFIKKLKEILSDDKITDQEIKIIKKSGKDLWK